MTTLRVEVVRMAEIRVLGPVEVHGPGGRADLIGVRQRAVVGALAMQAGRVLPRERLVDLLWGERPPRTAVKTLHSHVARARQALAACGLDGVLQTREPGYLMAVDPETVDSCRFERCVLAARKRLAVPGSAAALRDAVAILRRGLALWRGEVLADAEFASWGVAEAHRLGEARITALEDLWDTELRLGQHGAAVGELERLLVDHPSRERLVGLYMLALYRDGRHTAALDVYQRVRQRLADELGVDPGPALAGLHTAILRREPELELDPVPTLAPSPSPSADPTPGTTAAPVAAAVVTAARPAQLPARVGHFTGRVAELASLDTVLAATTGLDDGLPIAVVSGPAGMGKTALAVQWAHRVAGRFPDGHLFLDLRGHDPDLATATDTALPQLLRGLGVPGDRVPAEADDQASLYRSLLHDRRVLVLVDDVRAAEDVLPLVPGSATSLLVVTSRNTMAALRVRHAVHAVGLDALSHDESLSLLAGVLGADRVRREPVPAARLARLCGRMPLALRIAAAKLAAHPERPIGELAAELAGADRLGTLAVEGDSRTVRAVLASAHRSLSPAGARALRLLGLHPGPAFGVHLLAAASGTTVRAARACVDELVAAHLIIEMGGGRFRFHDLIRLFAHQCATAQEPAAAREEAVARMLDWYLTAIAAANRVLEPRRDGVVPAPRFADLPVPFDADRHAVLAFLDAERDNLLPVVRYAADRGAPVTAWQLTYLLTSFFDVRGGWAERVEMCRVAVSAAEATGDAAASAEMLRGLGVACHMTRRFEQALGHYERALVAVRACGDRDGEGHIHGNIANAYAELRRFDEAVAAYERVLDMHTATGNAIGTVLARRNLGYTFVQMGRAELSVEHLSEALRICREIDNPRLEAASLDSLGEACLQLGRHDEAVAYFRDAVRLSQRVGDRWLESTALTNCGIAGLAQGDHHAALDHLDRALAVSRELADPHVEAAALNLVGSAHLHLGDLAAAGEHLELALALRERVPDPYEEAHLHRNLADLRGRAGDPAAAARHRERAVLLYRKVNATEQADALAGAPAALGVSS